MKLLNYLTVLLIGTTFLSGCKDEPNVFIDPNAPAPSQVSNIQVTGTPGGAIITYDIPRDPNLAYVKASYEIRPGVFREAKASYYLDTLYLVGFSDTLEHEVKISTVGRNEKESDPIVFTVSPLTPPVKSVFETIQMDATFGGVYVTFNNETKAELGITVLVDTTGLETWNPVSTHYTASKEGEFSVRGMDTIEKKFAVLVQDRWSNSSDTLVKALRPLFEREIPKNLFHKLTLPGDTWQSSRAEYFLEKVWNGIAYDFTDIFAVAQMDFPGWFSIDLGQTVLLSRMQLFQRIQLPYCNCWARNFEIWGSNDPAEDGSWDSWTLLGAFEFKKPSGLPGFEYTDEDIEYASSSPEFIFPNGIPWVRYIRFKVIDTFSGQSPDQFQLSELTFFGQVK